MDLMERKFKHKKSRCCRFGFLCRKRAEENIEILHNRSLEARTANETNAVKSEDTSVNQPVVFGSNHQITDTNEYIGQINGFSREGDVEINQISSVKQTDLIMLEDALDQHLGNNEQQDKEKNKTFPEKHIDPKRPEDASNKQPDISYGDDQQIEDDVSKIDEENSKTCPEEQIDPKRPEDASNEQLDILCGDNQQTEDDVSEENGAKNKTCPEKIFRKKTGTTDKGRQYEDMITANVALKMVSDAKIEDFYIASNDEQFGNFDDVVIEIKTDRGIQTKALQLKHSDRGNLTIKQLTGKTGNFSITKYFNSVQNLLDKAQQFILLTTKEFKISEQTQFQLEGEEFFLKPIKVSVSEDNFDILAISEDINYCYKFQIIQEEEWTKEDLGKIRQYQRFFKNFYLYTNQEHLEPLKKSTMDKFNNMFCSNEETFKKYTDVISDWNMKQGKKEKLTRRMMQRAIALRLLYSHIEPFVFDSVTDKMKILREVICLFDITLLEQGGSNAVKMLWGDLNKNLDLKELNKIRSLYSLSSNDINNVENLDANMLTQLLWLMDKCPLIVREHESVEKAILLCSDAKFVLVGEGKCSDWMKNRPVFQNLSNLKSKFELYETVLHNFTISLQGKELINLMSASENNKKIMQHVTVNKLLEMSSGPCYIDGQKENFPNLYIERYLSTNIIDTEYLENANENTVVILSCNDDIEQLKVLQKYDLTDIDVFLSIGKISDASNFIMSKKNYSGSEFQNICSKIPKSRTVHHFKFLNNKNLEWIQSRGDISELRNYKSPDHSKNENEIWSSEVSNNINLITGDPGMGKTELTKSLKNNSCSKYWTVIMNPQDINNFFKIFKNCEASDYLKQFETFMLDEKYKHRGKLDQEFLKTCLKLNNVIYVWDALDEIATRHLDATSDLILQLSQKGFVQWVTARQHLRSLLEKKFNVLSVEIKQFSETEQDDYITKRLGKFISSVHMKRTIKKIKSTFALTQHIDILGIPLQIFMLTEVFLQNKETYLELLNNTFLLTDMYSYFIDGKFNFFYGGKVPVKGDFWEEEVRKKKEEKLKQYEKFALELIFNEEILKRLKIDCSQDVSFAVDDLATVGLVTKLQNGIQFVHVSFAEYFVALYFSNNFENIHTDIFFNQKYNNVRFFFDMLKGKNSPAHIAVLYRNFDIVKNCQDEILTRKDDCGRSALHLICSWGQRHPRLKVQKGDRGYVIEADQEFGGSLETKEYFEALLRLLEKCEISEKDLVFKVTPLTCARESESLGAELELLGSNKLQLEQPYHESDRINILYYSALLGYDKAVKMVVTENSGTSYEEVNPTIKFTLSMPRTIHLRKVDIYQETPLHAASSNGHEKMVECLVKCGADVNRVDEDGRTSLHAASFNGHQKTIKCLVKCGAELNRSDSEGRTPLHAAASNGHEKTAELLVEYGAAINCANYDGQIPLHAACLNGHEKTVECLVKCGAEINRTDNNGWTSLYAASSNSHEKTIECLVTHQADINQPDKGGWTPLFAASLIGNEKMVECLVKCGADINHARNDGQTPLYAASSTGSEKTVACLVKHGADINCPNKYGLTPLHVASRRGHQKTVELLVKSGAEISVFDNNGETPFSLASSRGHKRIVKFLREFQAAG